MICALFYILYINTNFNFFNLKFFSKEYILVRQLSRTENFKIEMKLPRQFSLSLAHIFPPFPHSCKLTYPQVNLQSVTLLPPPRLQLITETCSENLPRGPQYQLGRLSCFLQSQNLYRLLGRFARFSKAKIKTTPQNSVIFELQINKQ